MRYAILVISILLLILYFVVFHLFVPLKYKNKVLLENFFELEKRIEIYNKRNEEYVQKIRLFKEKNNTNKEYQNWALQPVPSIVVEFLQE